MLAESVAREKVEVEVRQKAQHQVQEEYVCMHFYMHVCDQCVCVLLECVYDVTSLCIRYV